MHLVHLVLRVWHAYTVQRTANGKRFERTGLPKADRHWHAEVMLHCNLQQGSKSQSHSVVCALAKLSP